MIKRSLVLLAVGSLVAAALAPPSEARVVRFVVEQQRAFAGGAEWGTTGAYERLDGTAYMEVDPRDPLNAGIVNLDKAPRNDRGMVEFSAPFFMLKPVDMARGNQKVYYAVNNRGNKSGLLSLPPAPLLPSTNDPLIYAGDGLQLRLGYTIVDAGWQGDVAPGNNRLFPNFPVATQPDGSPIVAAVRIEYSDRTIPRAGTFTLTLEGSLNFRSYETADTDPAHSTLTVRDTVDGPKVPIPSDRWAFGTCPTGEASLVPTTTDICLFDGFRADQLYELIYPAKNPMVMGLGYAVTRDIASFLRYETRDEEGNPNPLALSPEDVGIRRAYGFGASSTGMYLRDFLYFGFNEDEAHRKVFDAVHITIPGTHRLFANVEFADPNTYSRQDDRHDFLSTSYPPLTFAVTTDPISGIRDGILKRPATDPLVFQTDSAQEFWHFRASLNIHDGLGRPLRIPDNVRLYLLSSFSHIGASGLFAPPAPRVNPIFPNIECQNLTNTGSTAATFRALLIALDAWADQGIEPPRSHYPRLQNNTLVSLDAARAAFPAIPGVEFPAVLNELELLNFGPEFDAEGGRLTVLPPLVGPSYTVLVPKPDKDGLDIAGIRTMEVRAPLGTNTGWNVRAAGSRAPNLCTLTGSFIPFAETTAERLATGDPRLSLEERYQDHFGFVQAVVRAARRLVRDRFLLEEDADTYISQAAESDVLR
jgi:Alpha/beta hydrolase domain